MTIHGLPVPGASTVLDLAGMSAVEQAEVWKELRKRDLAAQSPRLWLYAIQADGYGGDIKLGISANPRARLKTLQVGTSQGLRGIAAWRGLPIEEKALHEAYAGHRLRGEWFMHSLSLYRHVRECGRRFKWER